MDQENVEQLPIWCSRGKYFVRTFCI